MTIAILAISCLAAGQNQPPSVVIRSNCTNKLDTPDPMDWFKETPLPQGGAYVASEAKRSVIADSYSKLKLGMSLADVEKLFGKPDFSIVLPRARLATQPSAQPQSCRTQVAYILRKDSENLMDINDVGVYLAFAEDGTLYWVVPQNVPELKPLGSPQ